MTHEVWCVTIKRGKKSPGLMIIDSEWQTHVWLPPPEGAKK